MTVTFYVSGHGFGHASRQIEVMRALASRAPDLTIHVVTGASRRLFARTAPPTVRLHDRPCDTGVTQIDSLRLDVHDTIARAAAFYRDLPTRVPEEAARLTETRTDLVIGDIPPLAFAAAAAADVPSIAISNFTWDWIYEGYTDAIAAHPDLAPLIRRAHGLAAAAWRLPLGGGFGGFRAVRDLPLIARHAHHGRDEVRRALALALDRPLVLVSFGGYGLDSSGFRSLDCLDRYGVVFTTDDPRAGVSHAPGVHVIVEEVLYGRGLRYEDLVAAVDVVVTKPGYGIVSECIANSTAMLYTSRGPFVEYDALVAGMPRFLRCRFIEQDALLAGRWRDALDTLMVQPPPPEQPPTDGADVAAELILEMIG